MTHKKEVIMITVALMRFSGDGGYITPVTSKNAMYEFQKGVE